jgi:hypothetical protein
MTTKILSVTFEKEAMHHKDGNFSIPAKVCGLLGLNHDDNVHLIISTPNGGHLFSGPWQMKSGYEIYGPEMEERIKAGDRIRVEISKP